MGEKTETTAPEHTGSQTNRPTIGLLIANISRSWEFLPWLGVMDAAGEQDVNLVCFPGRELHNPNGFEAQANVLFDLVDTRKLNGLVVWVAGLNEYLRPGEIERYLAKFQPLPIITAEVAMDGIPGVLMDNRQAMCDVISHLVEVHQYRKIAYVMHMRDRPRFQERHTAYTETLAKHGLPVDPELVSPPFDPDLPSSFPALTAWLQEKPVRQCDAIVVHSDYAVLHLLKEFHAQGVRIPQETAVTGFDDITECSIVTPPITTVRPPFYEMGKKAVEMLCARIRGDTVPEKVVLPSKVIVRQSCGCKSTLIAQVAVTPQDRTGKLLPDVLNAERNEILTEMRRVLEVSSEIENPELISGIFDGLVKEIEGPSPGAFLSALEDALHQVQSIQGNLAAWQGVITVLWRWISPYLKGADGVSTDGLWHQARVMIGEASQRARSYQILEEVKQSNVLAEIGQMVITAHDVPSLTDILSRELPRLDIPSVYLSVYEDPASPGAWSRLMFAYDENGRVQLNAASERFPSPQLVPAVLWPRARRQNLVVEPLFLGKDQLGFVLFEIGPRNGMVYELLRGQISSALMGAQLAKQVEDHTRELEQAYETLRGLSLTDDLTGLYNRRGFTVLAEQQMKLIHRMDRSLILLFTDMDGLKIVNDSLGHATGDAALQEIAGILKETFREEDILARLGGDEFVVLAMSISKDCDDILIDHLQQAVQMHNQREGRRYSLSLSVGVAHYDPKIPCTVANLIDEADRRMYQQKQSKKKHQ